MKLKDRYQGIVKDYINAFCDKQGCDFEFWVADIIGEVACFGDVFFNFQDIVFDIDTKQKRGLIFEWYDELEELDYNINYRTFTKLRNEKV